jgi:hypothetical protein
MRTAMQKRAIDSAPTSDSCGGSAPARVQVMAAQPAANDSA